MDSSELWRLPWDAISHIAKSLGARSPRSLSEVVQRLCAKLCCLFDNKSLELLISEGL